MWACFFDTDPCKAGRLYPPRPLFGQIGKRLCDKDFPICPKSKERDVKYMSQTVRPMLSIGMIVKNEEKKLEKCLRALEPLRKAVPCELVIADTGSTDGTRTIAEKYADQD